MNEVTFQNWKIKETQFILNKVIILGKLNIFLKQEMIFFFIFIINKGYQLLQFRFMNSELFKSTASTLKKISELPRYRHPGDLINMFVRPVRQQRLQIQGQIQFGKNLYQSPQHERLLQNLLKTRNKYLHSAVDEKKIIANNQFDLWNNYLNDEVMKLPETQQLINDKRYKLYEGYLNSKERNQQKIQLGRVVKLFYEMSLGYKFDIPLHPIVMMKLVYPHLGYLNNFKQQRLTFEQFLVFLEKTIVVRNTLHGNQLLSFVFWQSYSKKGHLTISQFSKLLSLFKFNMNAEEIKQGLKYHLNNRKGQIEEGHPVRFDFWRNIFLERGL